MIAFLQGEVIELNPTNAIILCQNGVGYYVHLSVFSSNKLKQNNQARLYITQIIKEDSHRLFGFLDKKEQSVFEMLLKVNGIGAILALNILSNISSDIFLSAIQKGDDLALKKIPGIGAKTAKKIIVELEGRINLVNHSNNSNKQKAFEALISLGFKEDKILKTLEKIDENPLEQMIKDALKIISKG